MTLCIVAPCTHEGAPAIVLCADCRAEKGLAVYSEGRIGSNDADKIRYIGESFAAVVAGIPTKADELLAQCDDAIFRFQRAPANQDSDIVVTSFFNELRAAARIRRQDLINHHIAMRTVFTGRDEFLKLGKSSLLENDYVTLLDEVNRINLGAEVVIADFHDDGPLIVRLDAFGETHWEDTYSVIGTGSDLALAFLCQNDYEESMTLPECLFRVLEAKYAAHRNRTVGELTSIQVMIAGKGRFDVSDKFFKQLKTKNRMSKIPEIETEDGWLETLAIDPPPCLSC
jgi:20S proteasome alpha/beta subunit